MESDLQLLIAKLVDLAKHPDWWSFGVTCVNAIIMIWLGFNQYRLQKQQTELQKRQTEAQEYELYRRLYLLVSQVDTEINDFFRSLAWSTWQPYQLVDKNLLQVKQKNLIKLKEDLQAGYVDYKLKFSKDIFDPKGYADILLLMSVLIQRFIDELEKGNVEIAQGLQRIYCGPMDPDAAYAMHIAKRFVTPNLRDDFMGGFMSFIEQKKKLRCNDELLRMLEKRCRIS